MKSRTVASCRAEERPDAGYATAAALAVSLAVAILAAALVMRGVAGLKLARADFRRTQAEYALSGAQALAAARLLNGAGPGRLAWSLGGLDIDNMTLLAEAEAPKLALAATGALGDKTLANLGAADPAKARTRLTGLDTASATPDQIEAVDGGIGWRACAASAISPWGIGQGISLAPTRPPNDEPGGARAGQVWRVQASTQDGWTDERIVRLIGRAETPSAMIWRRFGREMRGKACDTIIQAQKNASGATPAIP